MEIKPMATGQIDRPAYELTGGDLAALRREAQKLCTGGGDIVRQAAAGQRPEAVDGRMQRWLNNTSALLDPPVQQAQLVVVCQPDRLRAVTALAPAPAPAEASAPVLRTRPVAAAPIGPLTPEW